MVEQVASDEYDKENDEIMKIIKIIKIMQQTLMLYIFIPRITLQYRSFSGCQIQARVRLLNWPLKVELNSCIFNNLLFYGQILF